MSIQRVDVRAPARLHLGFLDPDASLGRKFGSIGVSIGAISTHVTATAASTRTFNGEVNPRLLRLVDRLSERFALDGGFQLHVRVRIPEHIGLGSGTQLALSVGTALLRLFGQQPADEEIAAALERGRRSGAGLALFRQGGLVVDGGGSGAERMPPVLSRVRLPEDWRVVLVMDPEREGLSGSRETSAFAGLAPMRKEQAAELCHHTLMGILPAAVEQDFPSFSQHVGAVQERIGAYFGPCQNGPYTSAAVGEALTLCRRERGLMGLGQTSWGPTGFVFVDSALAARELVEFLQARDDLAGLNFLISELTNDGACIRHQSAAPDSCL